MCTARPGQRISGAANPDTASVLQLKPKRKLMIKFFNDMLHLKKANNEKKLSSLSQHPFMNNIKQEISSIFSLFIKITF